LYLHSLKLNPNRIKQIDGTTEVSSFGMFGRNVRWGIGLLYIHTVGLWVGGVTERPMAHEGNIALRESLNVTLSFDHDLVDGAPAARFASTFTELLESGVLLDGEAAGYLTQDQYAIPAKELAGGLFSAAQPAAIPFGYQVPFEEMVFENAELTNESDEPGQVFRRERGEE